MLPTRCTNGYTKLLRQAPKKEAARMRREAAAAGKPIPTDMADEELALDLEAGEGKQCR